MTCMTGKKIYLQPADMVLNAVHDIAEMQKGRTTSCDSPHGLVSYRITMRGKDLEYVFEVKDIGSECSRVSIGIAAAENGPETARSQSAAAHGSFSSAAERADARRLIENEFALLDYALLDRAEIDYEEMEEWDRQVSEQE